MGPFRSMQVATGPHMFRKVPIAPNRSLLLTIGPRPHRSYGDLWAPKSGYVTVAVFRGPEWVGSKVVMRALLKGPKGNGIKMLLQPLLVWSPKFSWNQSG